MKTIEQIAKEIEAKRKELNITKETSSDKKEFFNGLADLLTNVSDYLVEELKHDNKVEVTNFPQPIKEVKVNNFRGIFGLLESISKTIKSFKLPDIFKVSGEVTVKNQIEIPKIDLPRYPTEIKVNNLVDYSKKLDEIKQKLSEIKLNPNIEVKNQAPQVSIDLEGVKTLLESLTEEIKRIQVTPEVNIDLESVKNASNETTQAIKELRFPIPNFSSSYQKSLDMRAKDSNVTIHYDSNGNPDYKQFVASDGNTYRKTITWTSGSPTQVSGWIKQ